MTEQLNNNEQQATYSGRINAQSTAVLTLWLIFQPHSLQFLTLVWVHTACSTLNNSPMEPVPCGLPGTRVQSLVAVNTQTGGLM